MNFNPDTFLSQTTTAALDTVTIPIPVGDYQAIIEKVEARTWTGKKDVTQSGVVLDVTWEILDESLRESLDRKKVVCRQGVMLDVTGTGALDVGKGKNVALGQLREATGTNISGQPFAFNDLLGRPACINIQHEVYQGNVSAKVRKVAAL